MYFEGGVVWSDIPNNRMLRWDEASGEVSVFRQPSGYANGNTLDPEGRLVTGVFDGLRFDADGRLWSSAGDGVHCFDPDGTLIGKVRLPEEAANVVFGGPGRDRLFITATTSLYAVDVAVRGA